MPVCRLPKVSWAGVFNVLGKKIAGRDDRLCIYLYVMHFVQNSMLVLDLSNKKKSIAIGFLCLYADIKKVGENILTFT